MERRQVEGGRVERGGGGGFDEERARKRRRLERFIAFAGDELEAAWDREVVLRGRLDRQGQEASERESELLAVIAEKDALIAQKDAEIESLI